MADLKRLEAAFIKADRANDTRAASVLAAEIKRLRGQKATTAAPRVDAAKPKKKEEGYFSSLGSAFQRGVPTFQEGLSTIIEDAPRILGDTLAAVSLGNVGAQLQFRGLGQLAAQSKPYKEIVKAPVESLRESAALERARLGPGTYGSFFEEKGLGRKLASLSETVAESTLPVAAGLTVGALTRSPTAAGLVMGAGSVPSTYGGIRERQKAEGIDDVGRAVAGTAASSALDLLTGVGGKVLSTAAVAAGKEILEQGLKAATVRVLKTGRDEAGTEVLQTVIEQVAGGSDPTTKQAMLEALEGGLAGALGGTAFGTAGELVAAPFRPKDEAVQARAPSVPGAPPPPPTAPPPADMGDLAESLGPVGGTVTLQDAFGPQEYTFQGFDKKGKVVLTDADGVTLSEDPEWVRGAIGSAAVESDEGLGGMSFGMDVDEDVVAPPPPPPAAVAESAEPAPAAAPVAPPPPAAAPAPVAAPAPKTGDEFVSNILDGKPVPPELLAGEEGATAVEEPVQPKPVVEAPSPRNTQRQSKVGSVIFDQEKGVGQVPLNQNVNYRGFTAMMRPSKFLELAADLEKPKQASLDYIRQSVDEGNGVGSPFLNLDFETGKVKSHDGRHRMMVIQEKNGDEPVPVHIFGKGEQRARSLDEGKINAFASNLTGEDGRQSTDNFSEAFLDEAAVPVAVQKPVQEPPAAPRAVGKAARATLPVTRQKVDVQYELQDLNNIRFAEGDLQNRDRSRPQTQQFLRRFTSEFDAEGLGEDPSTDRGAPVINKDNTILSGNGRTLGLEEIYNNYPEQAEAYREFLREQGYDIEGVERPVLVRRLMSDVDERKFVVGSNEDDKAALSPPEQAAQDAKDILTPGVLSKYKGGDLNAARNDAFVSAFIAEMSPQQRENAMDDKGNVSAQALKRIENALLYKAYGGTGRASEIFISKAMERTDDDTKTLTNSLVDVANDWIKFQQAVKDGEVDKKYDITNKLMESVAKVSDIKASGNSVSGELRSPDMVEPMDEFVKDILIGFHNDNISRLLSKKAIAEKLRAYTEIAANQQAEPDMFGMSETPSARAIWKRAAEGEGAPQSDLYASIQPISPKRRREILDDGGRVPSLSRGVAKLKKLWADGKIDAKEFAYEVASYSDFIEDAKNWKRWEDLGKLKVRGPDRIRSVLLEQKRKGNISEEEANFAEWFILRNENLLGDLGIAVRKPSEKSSSSGFYDVLPRVMYLIKGRTNDDTTVHEIMHHLERMMPQDIRMAIKRAWAKELDRVERLPYDGKNDKDAMFFKAIRAFHNQEKVNLNGEDLSPSEAFKFATNLISDGDVDGRLYQYVNPSEFWAVNATEIMRGRYEVQGSLLGRLRNWLRELSIKIKGLFKLDSNAPIIKALDSLAKGDGKFVSNQMLEEKPGDFSDISRPEENAGIEQVAEDLEGEPTAEPTPAKLSRVRQSVNRLRTSATWSNIASQFSGARAVDNWLARSYGLESLPETDSFYSNFETYLSKKNGRLQQLRRKYVNPIDDAVGDAIKNGVTMDDINDAIQARGAAERNAAIAEINEDMPDGGSGLTNAEADAKLRELQASGKMRYINRVVRLHDRLRDETQRIMVQDGLVSAETMAAWKKKYPNYTPYKGWAPSGDMTVDGQQDPHADYGSYDKGSPVYSRVSGLRAKPIKAAKGRSSQAANSLYNMIADAEMFLEMGQRNQIALQLDNTYQSDPDAFTGLLKIYDKNNPKIVKGKAVKITDERAFENGVRGFKNGEPFIIETAPNEEGQAVRRAFTNLDPSQLDKWLGGFYKVMGVMRGLHTRFNPAFWPREFLRSVSDAAGTVYTEKGRKRSAAYGKSAAMKTWMYSWDPATMAGVFSHLINREPSSERVSHVKALTEEMVVNGGAAGQEFAERAERVAKRMEQELDRLTATGVKAGYFETKAGFAKLIKVVDGINDFVDIVPRVAAYRALTEAGVAPKDAAQIALRSTLDMTKRGRFGRVIDGFFWWTTPSITNLTKKVTGLDSSTYRKLVLAQLSIGFALGMLNIMNAPDSDDDGEDDYSQLPEWRKLAYLHVYYSPNEKPFTAPIGFLFLFERYVGGKMAEVLAGKISDGKAAVDIMTASQDVGAAFLASLSPVVRSTEARTLVPSSFAPIWDLNLNESFFKAPIYNEPFDESEAQASRVKRTTPEVYKIIAKGLQEATDGYGRIPGGIDVSPDQIKYFVDQYAGGVGRLVTGAAEGDIEAAKKLNPFYFDPKLVQYSPMGRFYERDPEMKRAVAADKLADEGDSRERDFFENENPVAIDSEVITAFKDAQKELKDLRKDANDMDPDEYRAEQLRIMSDFNRTYNDVSKGSYSYTPSADEEEEDYIPEEEEGDE
jgi:hypothetical protein